jgi:hypothetical protein
MVMSRKKQYLNFHPQLFVNINEQVWLKNECVRLLYV